MFCHVKLSLFKNKHNYFILFLRDSSFDTTEFGPTLSKKFFIKKNSITQSNSAKAHMQ